MLAVLRALDAPCFIRRFRLTARQSSIHVMVAWWLLPHFAVLRALWNVCKSRGQSRNASKVGKIPGACRVNGCKRHFQLQATSSAGSCLTMSTNLVRRSHDKDQNAHPGNKCHHLDSSKVLGTGLSLKLQQISHERTPRNNNQELEQEMPKHVLQAIIPSVQHSQITHS